MFWSFLIDVSGAFRLLFVLMCCAFVSLWFALVFCWVVCIRDAVLLCVWFCSVGVIASCSDSLLLYVCCDSGVVS